MAHADPRLRVLLVLGVATLGCTQSPAASEARLSRRSSSGLSTAQLVSPPFPLDEPELFLEGGGAASAAMASGRGAHIAALRREEGLELIRLSPDGGLLDPGGAYVPTVVTTVSADIARGGDLFLVVWDDRSMLRATRVTESLDWLDQAPILLSGPTSESSPVRVAFNGTTFLVVLGTTWDELIGLLVDVDGGVENGFRLPAVHSHQSVGSLGSQFLVTWHTCSATCRTLAVRYSPDAGVLDSPPLDLGESVSSPRTAAAVTSDGDQYFVFWRNDTDVVGRRVMSDGGLPEPAPFLTALRGQGPAAVWTGSEVLVAAADYETNALNYEATTVFPDGGLGGRVVLHRASFAYGLPPRLATLGSQTLIIVTDNYLSPPNPPSAAFFTPSSFGRVVTTTPTLQASTPFRIQLRANSQRDPVTSARSANLLLAWVDDRGDQVQDRRQHVWASVTPPVPLPGQTGQPVRLSEGNSFTVVASRPRVASSGSDSLVAWQQGTSVLVGRVLADGGAPDYPGIRLGVGALGDVASFRNDYWVLWSDGGTLVSTQVARTATRIGEVSLASGGPSEIVSVRAEPQTAGLLVLWTQPPLLRGKRIFADGGAEPDGGFVVARSLSPESRVGLATNASQSLVTWTEGDGGSSVLSMAFGEEDGGFQERPFPYAPSPGARQESPAIYFDGAKFLVTWREVSPARSDVLVARFDSQGSPMDAVPTVVTDGGRVESFGGGLLEPGRVLVVNSQRDARLPITRLELRMLNKTGCESDSECPASACSLSSCNPYTATCRLVPNGAQCDGGLCVSGACQAVDAGGPADGGVGDPHDGGADSGVIADAGLDAGFDGGLVADAGSGAGGADASVDGGGADGGVVRDAGVMDASVHDASIADSGPEDGGVNPTDGGEADAADGGSGARDWAEGCQCSSAQPAIFVLLAVISRLRRGRRDRSL